MILGVSLRLLPHAYGFREPSQRWVSFLFWGLNGSILVGAALFIAGMTTNNHWLLLIQWLTTIVLLVIAVRDSNSVPAISALCPTTNVTAV